MNRIQFLPSPRSLQWKMGRFLLRKETTIVLGTSTTNNCLLFALDLQRFAQKITGIRLPIAKLLEPQREKNVIHLELTDDATNGAESYSLSIAPQRIHLKGVTPAGLLWAQRTLQQIIAQSGRHLPALEIEDAPAMRFRGVMLDVSRGKVPTLDALLELAEQLSFYKLNVLQLYIEHTFAFRHHPLIGTGCGQLTSEEILRLDDHCRRLGVELMPCLQSFGHMHHILKLPPYQHLAETERQWTITPAKEETYHLLEQIFDDFLPSFSSKFCNINCDETYDLGKGQSKAQADHLGVGRVYLNHILRLHKIVSGKHGRRMMMWGDIILHHPDLIAELPKDIIVMNWGYEATHPFETAKLFASSGLAHWVCPGTTSWNTVFPRIPNACGNIRGFVTAGIESGAAGMLNTDWGDGGHYNLQGHSWHGYLYGAECSWSGKPRSDREFDDAFGRNFFGKGGEIIARAIRQLAAVDEWPEMKMVNQSRSMHMLFHHPSHAEKPNDDRLAPITRATCRRLERAAKAASKVFAGAIKQRSGEARQTLREIHLAADLLAFAARKTFFLKSLSASCYSEPSKSRAQRDAAPQTSHRASVSGRKSLSASQRNALICLINDQRTLVSRFQKLWLARAKPEGMEITLNRFAAEEKYLRALAKRGRKNHERI